MVIYQIIFIIDYIHLYYYRKYIIEYVVLFQLGSTALHHAAEQGHFETVKELLSYGVCCNPSNMVKYLIRIS